ncbi:integral membrane PTH11 protein [Rutstroemia sp. NJR-2017a BVV2]|nr:integral membrane PTH11 protein [Rutstroemia sp. NJR-2017a BVV2]
MSAAAILAMTPEERAMTPAGVPPPGIIPNFINGPTRAPLMNVVGTCMVAIMLVLASLRFYTKLVVVKKTTWDDSGSACKYGTHVWDISIAELLSKRFIVAGFVVNFFTTLVWPFAKLSFFILYHQLFYPNVWLRRLIYLGAYVNVGFYFGVLVGTLYYTAPHPGESWEETYLSPRYAGIFNMTIPIAAGSLFLDIYIFLLPIFGIWNLQLTTKKKLGIMIVFGTGLTACVASSLKIYYNHILNNHSTDWTYDVLPVLILGLTEMCVGIAASCMPALTKMVRNDAKWLVLRSKISKTFGSLSGWGASKNRSSTYGSKDEPISDGAYSNLDEELRNPGFELKGIKAVKTTIKSGSIDNVEDDGIHLKYNLRQEVSTHGPDRTADSFV